MIRKINSFFVSSSFFVVSYTDVRDAYMITYKMELHNEFEMLSWCKENEFK